LHGLGVTMCLPKDYGARSSIRRFTPELTTLFWRPGSRLENTLNFTIASGRIRASEVKLRIRSIPANRIARRQHREDRQPKPDSSG
jgi:hypothetical protein